MDSTAPVSHSRVAEWRLYYMEGDRGSMRRRLFLVAVPAVLVLGFAPMAAHAADGDGGSSLVTATLTANAIGSRSVTLVAPITMTSSASSTTLSAAYSVTVTEATRSGTNPWSVTGDIGTLTDATS